MGPVPWRYAFSLWLIGIKHLIRRFVLTGCEDSEESRQDSRGEAQGTEPHQQLSWVRRSIS